MSNAIFLPDELTETLEIEAKLAEGRDVRAREGMLFEKYTDGRRRRDLASPVPLLPGCDRICPTPCGKLCS